jgi:hypothetical protein
VILLSGSFTANYNVGGDIDKVKKIVALEEVEKLDNVENVDNIKNIDNLQEVENVKYLDEIGRIRGFATKTQPYNFMKEFDIPALKGDYTFIMDMPSVECEILAITLTCSGYGEDDHYDLFFNDVQWFNEWYCSEVKEGLFLGTSTYVYAAPASSKIKLIFKNDSGTQKKIWLGVRALI